MTPTTTATATTPTSRRGRNDPRSPLDAARTILRLLWIDIRRSQGAWLLPLMVGLSLSTFVTGRTTTFGVTLWVDLNRQAVLAYLVIGPLAAALAAWGAGRDRRRRVAELAATAPGSGFRRDLLGWATATCWGLLAYGIVAAWLGVQGLRWATWGGPDRPLLATSALAIVLFAAIGTLTGRLLPHRFAPLLALVVTFLLTIGADALKLNAGDGSYEQPLKFLLPWGLVADQHGDVFFAGDTAYAPELLAWLAATTTIVLAVLALLRRRSLAAATTIALAALVAGSGAVALIDRGTPWLGHTGPVPFTWSCQAESGIEVCVHPAYDARLAELTADIAAIVAPVAGLEGVPRRWVQNSPTSPAPGTGELWGLDLEAVMWTIDSHLFPGAQSGGPAGIRPASQLVILHWLVQRSGIVMPWAWPFGWPEEVSHTAAQAAQGMYVPAQPDETALAAFAPEFQAAVDRFAALPADERRAWLDANWDALRAGDVTLDQLP